MKKLGLIIAFLWVSLSLLAQNHTGSLLWEISGKDLKKPSYILGTHHAVGVSFVDSIQGLAQKLKEVKQVVGEVDMSQMQSTAVAMIQYSMMPAGYSYQSLLSDDDYKLLDKILTERMGMGMDQMQALRPSMITVFLTQLYCSEVFPEFLNPNFETIDGYVQTKARSQKKNVIGLETIEEQFKLIYNSGSIEDQVKELLCLVKKPEKAIAQLVELTDFYYKKDLNKICELYLDTYNETDTDDDCNTSQYSLDGLNKERNDKWLKILPQIMKKKSSLIAVGAMHIAGEEGLLYKLSQMGYTVEAVRE